MAAERNAPSQDHSFNQLVFYVCRAVGQEIAALPAKAVVGFIKVSAKPLKASLSMWASKWVYLFTHYLQVRCLCISCLSHAKVSLFVRPQDRVVSILHKLSGGLYLWAWAWGDTVVLLHGMPARCS